MSIQSPPPSLEKETPNSSFANLKILKKNLSEKTDTTGGNTTTKSSKRSSENNSPKKSPSKTPSLNKKLSLPRWDAVVHPDLSVSRGMLETSASFIPVGAPNTGSRNPSNRSLPSPKLKGLDSHENEQGIGIPNMEDVKKKSANTSTSTVTSRSSQGLRSLFSFLFL